jgi:excinuclease ABC subunit A
MLDHIQIRGAREHNLKNLDLDLPRDELVVVTGLSGSGKSSLAFDTVYAEGQRRYMESLSAYARQFLGQMERPDVDFIDGLSPVIAIEQKTVSRNPRSTVGTVTEIYDFLRLLYARAADAFSHETGNRMQSQSDDEIIDGILDFPQGTRLMLLAPVVKGRKGHYRELFEQTAAQGYERVRVDGELQLIEEGMKLERYETHDIEVVVDRLVVKDDIRSRVAQSVEQALQMGGGTLIAAVVDGPDDSNADDDAGADGDAPATGDYLFSRHLVDPETGLSYDPPSPNTFSFNSPYGSCPECDGLGTVQKVDPELMVPHPEKTIAEGGLEPLGEPRDIWIFSQLEAVADAYDFDFETPLEDLTDEQREVIMQGAGEEQFDIRYKYKKRTVNYQHRFGGLVEHVRHTYENTGSTKKRRWAEMFMRQLPCPRCDGGRLRAESLSYKVGGKSIADLAQMDLRALRSFFEEVEFEGQKAIIARPITKEIRERLDFMLNVGVGYLTLDRPARTLSGGESQRIRLATQIGTQLTGVLYVLDEPSIGLHPRDHRRLIGSLKDLRDLGNSVLVVEHDREMIEAADHVVDLGPGAGAEGGHLIAAGEPSELPMRANGHESLTARYLLGDKTIDVPDERRDGSGESLTLRGATGHNLKGEAVEFPLGTFICVTGVSGSGKSTLVSQTLYPILARDLQRAKTVPLSYDKIEGIEHVDKVIEIDQQPIGRTPRSNPATYTKVFDYIRNLYAELPEAKIRGYDKGRFSFNTKGGRCEDCNGAGREKLEMNFLPDVYVECETCGGKRYNPETLEVRFDGASIADVLDMTVAEALEHFENVPRIERTLKTLADVGLGYITLGQQSTTVSGGEAQRIKLSKELSRPGTGDTVYILDEPTTGMHFEDIRHLLNVLHRLVENGNTVIVIEHNMDVVKRADHIIDLGAEGGAEGGRVMATGTPEAVAEAGTDTSGFLSEELERTAQAVTASNGQARAA